MIHLVLQLLVIVQHLLEKLQKIVQQHNVDLNQVIILLKLMDKNVSRAQQRTVSNLIKHLKHSVTLDIHRYPSVHPTTTNRDILSLLSSTGTVSTEDSSTCSDSSISYRSHHLKQMTKSNSNRHFVDLAQLGHYVEPKPLVRQTTGTLTTAQPFYEMTNSSMLAVKGSPTNTFV